MEIFCLTPSNLLFKSLFFSLWFWPFLSSNISPHLWSPRCVWPLQLMEFERYTPTAGLWCGSCYMVFLLTIQNNFNNFFQTFCLVFCSYFRTGLPREWQNKMSVCIFPPHENKSQEGRGGGEDRKPCRGTSGGRWKIKPHGPRAAHVKTERKNAFGEV